MKVLHVAETVIGGIASHLQEIADAQANRFGAANVAIIVPEDQVRELESLSGLLRPFKPAKRRPLSALKLAAATMSEARRLKPDIIHVHSSFAGVAVRMLPRRLLHGARVIYCPHGWSFAMAVTESRRRLYALIERLLSARCDVIINVSAHERDLALSYGLPADRLEVALNGIAATAAPRHKGRRVAGQPVRLAFVGRPGRQKGLDILLRAMNALGDRPVTLDVAGAIAADVDVDLDAAAKDRVHFHGWLERTQALELIAASDALVMPSRWEGLPLTALEAMRAGKAVIASDCCSFGEIVDHGRTGFLFETGDVSALADTLRGLAAGRLEEMGKAGRERFMRSFTAEAQERRISEIYQDLVRRADHGVDRDAPAGSAKGRG